MSDTDNTPRATPAFTTGGGGFAFEDRAGTWMVAAMISGESPLGSLGIPTDIAFQQKVPATALDDLVVTGTGESSPPRWFASIKAFDLLDKTGALADFVAGAWMQFLADDFDRDRDFVGFVSGQARDDTWTSLLELIETVRNDNPGRMAERIVGPRLFNETDRALWTAFKCPDALAVSHGVDHDTSPALLLSRLAPLLLDFRSADSEREKEAKQWCERALATGHHDRAQDLYNAVFEMVARTRPSGGSIDWGRLQRELGSTFPLARSPNGTPDWERLDQHTQERVDAVRDTLANGLRLPRGEARQELAEAHDAPFVYLTGPSGCGKTALAKSWLDETVGGRLWLTTSDLSDGLLGFGREFGLRLPLWEVISLGQAPTRIVIDGLDRSYDATASAAAAAITNLADRSAGAIQVLITSQAYAVDRVAQSISQANGANAKTVIMGDLDEDDIRIALEERPDLRRLLFQGQLRQVLKRPKMLQVVVQAFDATSDETLARLRDEADVADLWWTQLALGGSNDRAARGEFLRGLASWTGQNLIDALPAGDLRSAGLSDYVGVVDPLRGEEILAASENSYAFGHDLFADWTRFRSLGQWDTAEAMIGEKQGRPPWHRAIRLFALRTLREGGIDRWTEQHQALRDAGHDIAADLYLDAPLFSGEPEAHLDRLWPSLIAGDDTLLARMLDRFAHTASVPDPQGALVVMGGDAELQTYVAATWRIPIWILWPPVIRALAARDAEAVRAAPLQVAAIIERWLRLTPAGFTGRAEAARLGIAAGAFVQATYENGIYLDEDDKLKMWEAFLAAASELPDEVAASALEILCPTSDDEADL